MPALPPTHKSRLFLCFFLTHPAPPPPPRFGHPLQGSFTTPLLYPAAQLRRGLTPSHRPPPFLSEQCVPLLPVPAPCSVGGFFCVVFFFRGIATRLRDFLPAPLSFSPFFSIHAGLRRQAFPPAEDLFNPFKITYETPPLERLDLLLGL